MSRILKYVTSSEWFLYGVYHFKYFILNRIFYTFIFKVKAKLLNIEIGKNSTIYGKVSLLKFPGSTIKFGNNVTIVSNKIRATATLGDDIFRIKTFTPDCKVLIGNNTGFGGGGSISCRSTFIIIGDNCNIGPNIQILDSNVHCLDKNLRHKSCPEDDKGVIIGNNVFIGMNVTILKGVKIGDNAIIGANSVVIKDVKADAIYGGNPAVFLKRLDK